MPTPKSQRDQRDYLVKTLKRVLASETLDLPEIKWSYPTDKELLNEVQSELDIEKLFIFETWPKQEDYKEAVQDLKKVSTSAQLDPKTLKGRHLWKSYEDLCKTVKSFGGPKDPDSMLAAIKSGNPLPMPIVVERRNGDKEILGGATRSGIAALAHQPITALVINEKAANENMADRLEAETDHLNGYSGANVSQIEHIYKQVKDYYLGSGKTPVFETNQDKFYAHLADFKYSRVAKLRGQDVKESLFKTSKEAKGNTTMTTISKPLLLKALHRVLAGDVLQFPKDKNKDKDSWTDVEIEKLKERFKDNPKILKEIEKNIDPSKNVEPYSRSKTGLTYTKWATPHEDASDTPFPLPANVGDLQGVLGKDVLVGGQDPFTWADSKYKVTKKLLQKHFDKPLEIHTRSDLIAHDDYIAAINPNKHKVYMHIISTNDDIKRELEPQQPSARRRLGAARKLKENYIQVYIAHDIFENENLIPEVQKFFKLDELALRKYAKNIKVVPMKVKISDEAAEIVNEAVKDHMKVAAMVIAVLKELLAKSK